MKIKQWFADTFLTKPTPVSLKHNDYKELYESLTVIEEINKHAILGGVDQFFYIKKSRRRNHRQNKSKLVLTSNGNPLKFTDIEKAKKWIHNRPSPYPY